MGVLQVGLAVGAALSTGLAGYVLFGGESPPTRTVSLGSGQADVLLQAFLDLPVVRRAIRAEELARRRQACLSELPVMLDVVTLGLSAGLSFDSSLELYCERYETELSVAFSQALLSWRMGIRARDEELLLLADELDVVALRRFASVVSESLQFGTPLAESLERQAEVMREEQRSQVEEEIERVPVKMLIPLGTLIVPALFLAILGPLLGSTLAG